MGTMTLEEEIINSAFDDIALGEDKPLSYQIIHHYTSPYGLTEILGDKDVRLWFTRYDCVNDRSEGLYVMGVYVDLCRDLLKKRKISERYYEAISNICIENTDMFHYTMPEEHIETDDGPLVVKDKYKQSHYQAYICSFSGSEDALPMWNYYVKEGKYQGYNIGFLDLDDYLTKKKCKGYRFELFKIIYETKKQREILERLIMRFYPYRNEDNAYTNIPKLIKSYLEELQLRFKMEHFKHENEIRAMIKIPTDPIPNALETEKFQVKYRDKNGLIIPYLEMTLKKSAVQQVWIGPMIAQTEKIAESTIKDLLQNRGYSNVDVYSSEIPVRN